MTAQVLEFEELSEKDRKRIRFLCELAEGDRLEVGVKPRRGNGRAMPLPSRARAVVKRLLDHLQRGERVAVLAEDQELTPNAIATILGISRPLVVHRMDVGDLAFRYVGKHRRAALKDVLALKTRLEAQQQALDHLAKDTESLVTEHGL